MIASLVALSAANIRDSRSFCWSALAFSLARSKLSSATETLSAIRASRAMISSSAAQLLPTKEHQYADALAELGERQCDAAHDAGIASQLPPRPGRLRDIVVDA